jgi:hypothetical protein
MQQKDIPWDAIKRDIRAEVESRSEIFPNEIVGLRQPNWRKYISAT